MSPEDHAKQFVKMFSWCGPLCWNTPLIFVEHRRDNIPALPQSLYVRRPNRPDRRRGSSKLGRPWSNMGNAPPTSLAGSNTSSTISSAVDRDAGGDATGRAAQLSLQRHRSARAFPSRAWRLNHLPPAEFDEHPGGGGRLGSRAGIRGPSHRASGPASPTATKAVTASLISRMPLVEDRGTPRRLDEVEEMAVPACRSGSCGDGVGA
jgi:hypothetical protein